MMVSFTWNKIAGAVLGTALFIMLARFGAEALFHVEPLEHPGYIVEGLEERARANAQAPPPAQTARAAPMPTPNLPTPVEATPELANPAAPVSPVESGLPDFARAIASANLTNGQMIAERCAPCHNWEQGGGNLIGPNLFAVVESAKASVENFSYSPAFQALEGDWNYAELFAFFEQPTLFAPGTFMAFAGLPDEQDRLDLIAYMRSWSNNPASLTPEAQSQAP
ncbi:MAG: c-type cytochrome [Alphaproteobacteria bacterium]